jgi:hypothetical protein
MSNILMVPIHLDALCVKAELPVRGPSADFSRLPYMDGTRDVNGDVANISEEIVVEPFANQNLFLGRGIHLHWALPDALTKGVHCPEGTVFPSVPNRWLVIRSLGGEVKHWIVESDYLHPDGAGEQSGSVNIPVTSQKETDVSRPFRFLGRKMPLEAWMANDSDEHLRDLTAVGYGEPTFAAFYPNCLSVFGFYDADYHVPERGLQYHVLGWHSAYSADPLGLSLDPADLKDRRSFIDKLETQLQWTLAHVDVADETARFHLTAAEAPEGTVVRQADTGALYTVSDATRLDSDHGYKQIASLQMVCYSKLTFQPVEPSSPNGESTEARVAIANTGTEALSALLANMVSEGGRDPDQIARDKATIEDQLEALSLSSQLEHRQVDVGPKFKEARHAKGFSAVAGGSVWTVTSQSRDSAPANVADASAQIQLTLPEETAHQLNRVNTLQQAFDRAEQEIDSMRTQLFSDWYKYMLCAYPPEDSRDSYPDIAEVRNFIELKDISPLQEKIVATGDLKLGVAANGNVRALAVDAGGNSAPTESLAFKLAEAINALQDTLTSVNDTKDAKDANLLYVLAPGPGPRYYEPNNPVVLMTGPDVTPNLRHGFDGRPRDDELLECHFLPGANLADLAPGTVDQVATKRAALIATIAGKIEQLAKDGKEDIGITEWSQPPWNPFLLEWEVEVFPIANKSNLDPATGRYASDFITSNYSLEENDVDVRIHEAASGTITQAANVYTGASILTPHASISLKGQLDNYLKQELLADYYRQTQVPESDRSEDYFSKNLIQILEWAKGYLEKALVEDYTNGKDPGQNPSDYFKDNSSRILSWASEVGSTEAITYQILACRRRLEGFYSLSQALGGFNEGLLMHKQTLQLPIADPLGFDDYKPFTADVAKYAADNAIHAPQPLNDFNPIRSGAMKLRRLRLVDTFGQVRDVDCETVVTTEQLKIPGSSHPISLPPRLAQPARINLRWLSATKDDEELNDHPATSPICGWVLANNLDNSLMIYDSAGKSLGSIDQEARWQFVPGSDKPMAVDNIPNPHLRKMVQYIQGRGEDFMEPFITALDVALENIEPENFAQHQDIALLMGRPIALVRASLNLELQGLPALDQGWNDFRQDLKRNRRDTNGFEEVEFPIRVGEYQQFNDGVVGYWKDAGGGYTDNTFYAPQSEESPLFALRDIIDPSGFASQLTRHADAVSQFLWEQMKVSDSLKADLAGSDTEAQRLALVNALNAVLARGQPIYDSVRFQGVTLSQKTTDKIKQSPGGEELVWLNRWLLEEAFPDRLSKTQRDATEHDFIKTHADGAITLTQSIAAPPQTLALLIDPRGKVHATSGILPAKQISLPPDQYADALKAIEITFLSTPVVTDQAKVRLPLPAEPGFKWSWLEKDQTDWSEISSPGIVTKELFLDALSNGESVWQSLQKNGWVTTPDFAGRASIIPRDKRTSKQLPEIAADLLPEIEGILDSAEIGPINPGATFTGPQQIREGWLKLSNADQVLNRLKYKSTTERETTRRRMNEHPN